MMYNPVRILGLIGLGGVGIAVLAFLGLLIARLSGSTSLGPWGIAGVFVGAISGVVGVSLYTLGVTFNRLVKIINPNTTSRQGIFGGLIFKESPDRYFGWAGLVSFLLGIIIGICSLLLGFYGWSAARQFLYLFGSTVLILLGVQLIISWILVSVLDELSQRQEQTKNDLAVTNQ